MAELPEPHRRLRIDRLYSALAAISTLESRDPLLEDPEYQQWSRGILQNLTDLFPEQTGFSYAHRFAQISFRRTTRFNRRLVFHADFRETWKKAMGQARTVLTEAIEEAELGAREQKRQQEPQLAPIRAPATPPVVVTINNVFSPSVHVTLTQILAQLQDASLEPSERAVAEEHLRELDSEIRGEQRWQLLARSLEGLKAIGKNVYKDFAVPLLVEMLKRQAGIGAGA